VLKVFFASIKTNIVPSNHEFKNDPKIYFDIDYWLSERDDLLKKREYFSVTYNYNFSAYLHKLKKTNTELLEKLRNLSAEVSYKLGKAPYAKQNTKAPLMQEAYLMQEVESLEKLQIVLEHEIISLNSKVNIDTSFTKVQELEKKLQSKIERNNQIIKKIKDINKSINFTDKKITKNYLLEPKITINSNNEFLQNDSTEQKLGYLLGKELEKTAHLTQKIKQNEENVLNKAKLYEEIELKINKIQSELAEIKKNHPEPLPATPHSVRSKAEIEFLKSELEQLRILQDMEAKKSRLEAENLTQEIEFAKNKLKEFNMVFLKSFLNL